MKMKKLIIKILFMCYMLGICLIAEKNVYVFADTNVEEVKYLKTDKEEYMFESNGYVELICVYGITEAGEKINLTEKVQYFSEDETIASIYDNSIRAEGVGSTNIWITYNEMQLEIPVYVNNYIDLDELETSLLLEAGYKFVDNLGYKQIIYDIDTISTTSRTAQEILDKAVVMKNVRWIPTQDLTCWDNGELFKANEIQIGIPYSQNEQVDEELFLERLNNASNFYKSVYVTITKDGKDVKVICPRYGVDCSGYVSFALGITRRSSGQMVSDLKNGTGEIIKVGNYDPKAPKKSELYSAYQELQPGNALAHNGHAILVVSNDTSTEQIIVYETTNRLPKVSIYKYSTLWNSGNNNYFPFKREE